MAPLPVGLELLTPENGQLRLELLNLGLEREGRDSGCLRVGGGWSLEVVGGVGVAPARLGHII